MAYKLTQRGSMDNEITNTFFCDAPEDLEAIRKADINLGSVAVVVDPFEMFIANSSKEWISLTATSDDDEEEEENVEELVEEEPNNSIQGD